MPRHLLGKPVPRPHHPSAHHSPSYRGALLLGLPLVVAGGILFLQPSALRGSIKESTRQVTVSPITRFVLAENPATSTATTTTDATSVCESKDVKNALSGSIFPLIPEQIRDFDNSTTKCVPALWGRTVITGLIYKALALLNWVAGALAILSFLYAGILYLYSGGLGLGKEDTLKTAKNIIVGTVVALAVISSARLIVGGSFQLFGNTQDTQNLESLVP